MYKCLRCGVESEHLALYGECPICECFEVYEEAPPPPKLWWEESHDNDFATVHKIKLTGIFLVLKEFKTLGRVILSIYDEDKYAIGNLNSTYEMDTDLEKAKNKAISIATEYINSRLEKYTDALEQLKNVGEF